MENEKQINLTNFEKCRNIKFEDVGKFLQEQGYNWTGYIYNNISGEYNMEEFETDHKFYFHKPSTEKLQAYNHFLIWTNDFFNEDFYVNCNNNKFVRYIYFGISTFKVFTVIQDKEMPKYLTTKLAIDLSKEWVQFLAKTKEDYKPSLIQLMIKRKQQAEQDLENSKQHIINEKAKLDEYLEKRIVETNEEINLANTTTEWLEELN